MRLEPNTHTPQYVRQFIHKLNSQLKADSRSLQSQSAGLKRELQSDTKDIQSLMAERDRARESLEIKARWVNFEIWRGLCQPSPSLLLIVFCR